MSFSPDFKVNVNRLNATENLLILLKIEHPFLSTPIFLINDNKNLISNSDDYLPMPFKLKRQNDVQGELPKVSLTIPNVGRSLVRWIDSSGGGIDAVLTVKLARRSSPNLIEESIDLGIESINVSTEAVVFNLVVQNNLTKTSMRFIYDKARFPGLF